MNKFGYDPLMHRLTDISADTSGALEHQQGKPPTPFHRLHYDYDQVGNITHLQNRVSVQPWRNAAVFVGPQDVTYTYDNLYQLKTLTGKYRPHVAYGYQYSDSYTYDEIGNMTKKAQSQDRLVWTNQNVTPTTDPVQAMAQLNGSTFDHNVTGLTYSLDYQYANGRPHAASTLSETLPNQAPSPRAVAYDANGNNLGNTFKGTTRTQTWDEEDRLKQVTTGATSLAKFKYNEQGERTKKQTAAGDSWYVNQYFVLQPNNLPTKHIFAGETRLVSKTDAIYMQAPAISYYHGDNLGSTSYTSASNQDLLQHERYFAFGELWRPGAEQEENDQGRPDNLRREYLFLSKEWDVDTSLYYFGARYFDPHADAWQSPDPILASFMQGVPNGGVFAPPNLGLYSYAWNNPVILSDPKGLAPENDRVSVTGKGRHQVTRIVFDEGDPEIKPDRPINQGHTPEQEAGLSGLTSNVPVACTTCTLVEEGGKVAVPSSPADLAIEAAAGPVGAIVGKIAGRIFRAAKLLGRATRGGPKLLRAITTPTTLAQAVGNQGQVLVNQALKGRTPLTHLTLAERAEAARFFRSAAEQTTGRFKDAAAEFNRLRADYLEGLTNEVPGTLPDFMARRGYGR